ncbi:uncharacterized protein BDR25DRAFT_249334 [Lindgomyces ingoldianus]|uniref:Uncharacterized protein n=1 Tax=Lindgomyces ingoldianus TaxID=673940 RepID=A0ACB6RGE2_9PLEO|nr:uncharacterized protein BDR25DRAFT_249334 [Lindgomyces ingoldianus]KAF2477395.1 hypothetical protein BDR25DRAFT_249334 [Lindgomyces ingoldianus]
MAEDLVNSLISTTHASDTSPSVQLHPLVLLTISDSITRHTLRQQKGPVAGAILGQQNGQEITMEVAFQAKLKENDDGDVVLDDEWFSKRLDDFKDVHKQPPLDIVGWFTLGPASGPQLQHLPIHRRISELYNDTPILCLFHPADARSEATAAGKLPLTLYESVYENPTGGPNDKAMDIDGAVHTKLLKFKELVYTVETGEAEMIGVDFVARGGGNATAVEATSAPIPKGEGNKPTEEEKGKKGKGKQKEKQREETIDESTVLTAEDEELLSTLTAKANAIRMLSRRISLLRAYLASLPPSYLSDHSLPLTPPPDAKHPLPLNHTILRSISAMLSRINILAPPDSEAFTLESHQESSDVQLIALLSSITNSVSAAKEFGRKSNIIEHAKHQGRKGGLGMMMSGYEGSGGPGNYLDIMGAGGGRQFGAERWG